MPFVAAGFCGVEEAVIEVGRCIFVSTESVVDCCTVDGGTDGCVTAGFVNGCVGLEDDTSFASCVSGKDEEDFC